MAGFPTNTLSRRIARTCRIIRPAMTITELMLNFRAGLLGVLPAVEAVHIPWKRPDAYDEWDAVAASIFQALVITPIRHGVPQLQAEAISFPDYDMLLPRYDGMAVIEVLPELPDGTIRVFHALGTSQDSFDTVEWRAVLPSGAPATGQLLASPLASSHFALRPSTLTKPTDRIGSAHWPKAPAQGS